MSSKVSTIDIYIYLNIYVCLGVDPTTGDLAPGVQQALCGVRQGAPGPGVQDASTPPAPRGPRLRQALLSLLWTKLCP